MCVARRTINDTIDRSQNSRMGISLGHGSEFRSGRDRGRAAGGREPWVGWSA